MVCMSLSRAHDRLQLLVLDIKIYVLSSYEHILGLYKFIKQTLNGTTEHPAKLLCK